MKVPFFGKDRYFQAHSGDIAKIMNEVYTHGKVLMGDEVSQFEEKIAQYCNRKYGIAVGSCTDALYFSLLGSSLMPGDDVIVTGFSFIASASCILRAKAKPNFVDINPDTYMMDECNLEKKINSETKAIVAVDIFGDALNIDSIESIARKNNLILIEDAAQSIGSNYMSRKVGSLGLCSCISFDPTKILSAQSNGGVVLTDDQGLYEYISALRYHGKNIKNGKFEMLGYNSRLSTFQAALLSYNLDLLDGWISRNRELAAKYISGLSGIKAIKLPLNRTITRHVYHKFVIALDERDKLNSWLKHNGIETMIHYGNSLPENELFADYVHKAENLANINSIKKRVLSLPINPWLKDDEVDYVIEKVQEFFR